MRKLQQEGSSLRDHVSQEEAYASRVGFFYRDGPFYCVWKSRRPDKGDKVVEQLVLLTLRLPFCKNQPWLLWSVQSGSPFEKSLLSSFFPFHLIYWWEVIKKEPFWLIFDVTSTFPLEETCSWSFKNSNSLSSSTVRKTFSVKILRKGLQYKVLYKTVLQISPILSRRGSNEFYLIFADIDFFIVIFKPKGLGKTVVFRAIFSRISGENLDDFDQDLTRSYGFRKTGNQALKLMFPFMVTSSHFSPMTMSSDPWKDFVPSFQTNL